MSNQNVLAAAPAVQNKPSCKEMYKEFSEWCQNNRGFDLDCRLHTHGGPIDRGGYISDGETRVAFAAYRAGRLLAPQPAEQQPAPDVLGLVEALELVEAAQDEQYPPCDFCGVTPDHHPWHGSGMFKGVDSPHIHACNGCRHLLPSRTAQPAPDVAGLVEPVAWLWVKGAYRTVVAKDFADGLIEDGEAVAPLYTAPQPALDVKGGPVAPSSFVNAAGINASDAPATVIRKLDSAFHDVVTFADDAPQPAVLGEPVAGGPLHPSQVRALRRNVKRNCPPEIYALLDQAIAAPQPAEQQPVPVFSDEDHVSMPRGLIAAACSAIDKKRDAKNVLSELRRYTLGDLSRQTEPDVKALVEALETIADYPWHRDHEMASSAMIKIARAALAAHRKQGGEV